MSITESHYHQLQQGVLLNHKYRIEKVLGEGGFGITYQAVDTVLDLSVAIKEYYLSGYVTRETNNGNTVMPFSGEKKEIYEEGKRKFIKEARSLGKLAGQRGIVAVRDYFEENNTAYIVMEFLDGITLKGYLKQAGGRLSVEHTFELVEPVLKSLVAVHEQGIIHRDISPDNIMVLQGNSVKLLDFGAAREVSINGEKSLSVLLKPGYAPEEQYRTRGEQGPWSDIYALCATIYRCITGKVPVESMERLRNDTLKPPSALGVVIDKERERTLMQGLSLFKEKRIQDTKELYEAWYGPLEVTENVKKQTNKFWRKIKRWKNKIIIGLTSVTALVLGVCIMYAINNMEIVVADTPGEIVYSSPVAAGNGEKTFLRQETGLLWGLYDSEIGIKEEQVLFSDLNLGEIMIQKNNLIYMSFPGIGLVSFSVDGSSSLDYLANDAIEDSFAFKDDFLYYIKASDSHLYSFDLLNGKEKLISEDTFMVHTFTFYQNELYYYTEDGKKGEGIYSLNLNDKKSRYVNGSKDLGEIAFLRSGNKILYALNDKGDLFTIHPGNLKITEERSENIHPELGIYVIENSGKKGFYFVDSSSEKICFYNRTAGASEIKAITKGPICLCDYVDNKLYFVCEDGSYGYLTQKGAMVYLDEKLNYFEDGIVE